MKEVKIHPPAYDNNIGKLVYPISPTDKIPINSWLNDVEKLPCKKDRGENYICTECGNNVFSKRGTKVSWHFSHYPDDNCRNKKNNTINEGDHHLQAKNLLYTLLKNKVNIHIFGTKCSHCNNILKGHNILYLDGDEVYTERIIDDNSNRADVAIINNGNIRYIFEVFNTSKTKSYRPEPWFEISSDQIIDKNTGYQAKDIDNIQLNDIKEYICGDCEKIRVTAYTIQQNKCNNVSSINDISSDNNISPSDNISSNNNIFVEEILFGNKRKNILKHYHHNKYIDELCYDDYNCVVEDANDNLYLIGKLVDDKIEDIDNITKSVISNKYGYKIKNVTNRNKSMVVGDLIVSSNQGLPVITGIIKGTSIKRISPVYYEDLHNIM
jgi:hypothetical protein